VITVLQLDLMTTYQRGMLRFLGCLLGATLGLLLLGLNVDNTLVMSLIVFWSVFPLAYIWASGPNAAYIGAQAALALIITLFPDRGPATTLAPVIERLVGIFLAVLMIWALNLLLWPQDLTERLEKLLYAARKRLLDLGDLINQFYWGQSPDRPSGMAPIDWHLIGATTDILEEQAEISPEEASRVKEWVDALDELFDESADLMDLGSAPLPLLRQLRSDLGERLSGAVKALATDLSITEARKKTAEIDDLMESVRVMAEGLREVAQERDTHFKVACSLHILTVRRMLFRLKRLWELDLTCSACRKWLPESDAEGPVKRPLPVRLSSTGSLSA